MLYILQPPQQSLVDDRHAAGARTNHDPQPISNARDVTHTDGNAKLILIFRLLAKHHFS